MSAARSLSARLLNTCSQCANRRFSSAVHIGQFAELPRQPSSQAWQFSSNNQGILGSRKRKRIPCAPEEAVRRYASSSSPRYGIRHVKSTSRTPDQSPLRYYDAPPTKIPERRYQIGDLPLENRVLLFKSLNRELIDDDFRRLIPPGGDYIRGKAPAAIDTHALTHFQSYHPGILLHSKRTVITLSYSKRPNSPRNIVLTSSTSTPSSGNTCHSPSFPSTWNFLQTFTSMERTCHV